MYSVTNHKSFDMVHVVYDKIINFCGLNSIPCVIVGSKIDLENRYVSFSQLFISPSPFPLSCRIYLASVGSLALWSFRLELSPTSPLFLTDHPDRCRRKRANNSRRSSTLRMSRRVRRRT